MPTQKRCPTCQESIGVASKVCKFCGARQPYKRKLEQAKEKISARWKETQKKNKSVNKVYDATNLVLHKWNQLDRHPILLLAKRVGQGFVTECLCPQPMPTPEEHDALLAIQRIYENILKVARPPEPVALPVEPQTEAEEALQPETEVTVKTEPEETPATEPLHLLPDILPYVVPAPASDPTSASRPELSPASDPVISLTVNPGSTSSPSTLSSSLPYTLSTSAPALKGRNKNKRKADHNECPVHHGSTTFPYERILRERVREGHAEVLVRWCPCSGCGAKWEDTWEPKENFT